MKAAWIFILLLFVGCTHTPPRVATGLRQEKFWNDQAARRRYFVSGTGKAGITFAEQGRSVSGQGRLLWQKPELLRFEIRDPLGRVQYLALVNKAQFTAYVPSKQEAVTDAEQGREYSARSFGVRLSFLEMRDLFVGLLPESGAKRFESWTWSEAETYYVGVLHIDGARVRVLVDPVSALPVRIDWRKARGEVVVSYSEYFALSESLRLAEKVELRYAGSSARIEVEWGDLDPVDRPKGMEAFEIKLPKEVEVRKLVARD